MSQSFRKIFGALLILALMAIYAIVATAVASANLADSGTWVHLLYFLVTGLIWILPAMYIIRWMLKPDVKKH